MIPLSNRIGFMQGRLSPMIDRKIQAFPWDAWKDEFLKANNLSIRLMEWTLDQDRLYENPLMTELGRSEINNLCTNNDILIPSLTGDCFMQMPFWKTTEDFQDKLRKDFTAVVRSCIDLGISILVVPLVDNGKIENIEQENTLIEFMQSKENFFLSHQIKIAFESDFPPDKLSRFICRLNPNAFGINYDIGNSAALGFCPEDEFNAYGERIINVHVKDRKMGGSTVALGAGDADFDKVFSGLSRLSYQGNFILQTARAIHNEHAEVLSIYRDQTLNWLKKYVTEFKR